MSRGFPEKINSMTKEEIDESVKRVKESKSKYNKKYYETNREEISKKRKEKYKENREAILKRNIKWLENNRDQWNEYMRKWRLKQKLDKNKKV